MKGRTWCGGKNGNSRALFAADLDMQSLLAHSVILLVMQLQAIHLTRQPEDVLDDRTFGWLVLQTLQRGWTLTTSSSPDSDVTTLTFSNEDSQLVLKGARLKEPSRLPLDERPTLLLEIDHQLTTALEQLEQEESTPTPAVYLMLEARASSPRADGLIEPLAIELLEAGVPLTGDPTHAVLTLCVYSHGFAVQLLDKPPESKCGDGGDVWAMSEDAEPDAWRAKLTAHIKAKFEARLAASNQQEVDVGEQTPRPLVTTEEREVAFTTAALAGATWRGSADARLGIRLDLAMWEKLALVTTLQTTPLHASTGGVEIFEGDLHAGVAWRLLEAPRQHLEVTLAMMGGVWWHRWVFLEERGREVLPSVSVPLQLRWNPWRGLVLGATLEAGASNARLTHTGDGDTLWTRGALRVGAGVGLGWLISPKN
jgi:hypothetical protein